jgi:uncharacterized protein
MKDQVRDNADEQRFELKIEDATAFLAYRREGEALSLDHTEVPEHLSGRGVGSALVEGTLKLIRSRGLRVIARCTFVAAYIERHPEYRSMLAGS